MISLDGSSGIVVLGEIPLVGATEDEKVSTFLSWVEEYRPRPRVKLALRDREWCANTFLNNFYLSDALRQALEGTQEGAQARAAYRRIEREIADVFATYLLIATAGELRHAQALRRVSADATVLVNVGLNYQLDRRAVQHSVLERLSALGPKETITFLEAGVRIFRDRTWASSYGGEKWAVITETLLQYLQGRLRSALFVDRVFDLRHNGGRLFDKHPMVRQTNEGTLQSQLNFKKSAQGLGALADGLLRLQSSLSPDVQVLLNKWRQKNGA